MAQPEPESEAADDVAWAPVLCLESVPGLSSTEIRSDQHPFKRLFTGLPLSVHQATDCLRNISCREVTSCLVGIFRMSHALQIPYLRLAYRFGPILALEHVLT